MFEIKYDPHSDEQKGLACSFSKKFTKEKDFGAGKEARNYNVDSDDLFGLSSTETNLAFMSTADDFAAGALQ